MAISLSLINTWLLINDKPLLFNDGYDNREVGARESYNYIKATAQAPADLEIFVCEQGQQEKQGGLVELDDTPGSRQWGWQPTGKGGHYELHVELPGYPHAMALINVDLGPISKRYKKNMLADLRTMQDFLFLLGSKYAENATLQVPDLEISALREYRHIKYIIDKLRPVMAEISRRPHSTLQQQHQPLHIHEIRKFSSKVVPQWQNVLPYAATSAITTQPLEYLPETWIITRPTVKHDTYENRLLKQFIQKQLLPKLSLIRERAAAEIDRRKEVQAQIEQEMQRRINRQEISDLPKLKHWQEEEATMINHLEHAIEECQQMMQECNYWLNQPFLFKVGSISVPLQVTQVLLKNPLYHRFYRLYLAFQQTLALNLDTEYFVSKLSTRQMSGIYQVWSVFALTRMIITKLRQNDYQSLASHGLFYEAQKNYFHFDLRGNVTEIILTKGIIRVEIKYEPRYIYCEDTGDMSGLVAKSARLGLTPDMAVEVYKGERFSYLLLFDAKNKAYRVGKRELFYDDDEESLHKYTNGIKYKPSKSAGQKLRDIRTIACILYPGNVLDWVPSDASDFIGALPLIPNMLPGITKDIDQAIDDILSIAGLIVQKN